jgi:hypothetical protein
MQLFEAVASSTLGRLDAKNLNHENVIAMCNKLLHHLDEIAMSEHDPRVNEISRMLLNFQLAQNETLKSKAASAIASRYEDTFGLSKGVGDPNIRGLVAAAMATGGVGGGNGIGEHAPK